MGKPAYLSEPQCSSLRFGPDPQITITARHFCNGRTRRPHRRLNALPPLFAALVIVHGSAETAEYSGRARVINGDTISIRNKRIRIAAIDACERDQIGLKDGKVWHCGVAARSTSGRWSTASMLPATSSIRISFAAWRVSVSLETLISALRS